MLLWAMKSATGIAGEVHPDYRQQSSTDHLGLEVSERCVPRAAQELWTEHFRNAVEMMFQKTLHGMQHGLLQVGHSTVELVDSTSCGFLAHDGLDKLRAQAERLQVLVSAGSLNDLDVNVQYEPLKGLTVAGIDIHSELNALLIAWQLNKGPEEMGRALQALLHVFDIQDDVVEEVPKASSDKDGLATADANLHETRTPQFWTEVLQQAMLRLGSASEVPDEACVSVATARHYGDALEAAIAPMIEKKTRRGMRAGIEGLASATVSFVDGLEAPCSAHVGAKRLRIAASRLHVFASAKSLVNVATHVEYEPLKFLRVGGIDVHKELNRFLSAWIRHHGAAELAEGLVDFFQDFKEHDVEEAPPTPLASSLVSSNQEQGMLEVHTAELLQARNEKAEMLGMLRDAISPSRRPGEEVLAGVCLTDERSGIFVQGIQQAIDYMLQKQVQSMQLGLAELANVSINLFQFFQSMSDIDGCWSQRIELMQQGAQKLQSLTGKTTVDFGTLIQYEALKTLVVGSVDIHEEINDFAGAWKLRSRREAGAPFGELMRKLVTIKGHEEL